MDALCLCVSSSRGCWTESSPSCQKPAGQGTRCLSSSPAPSLVKPLYFIQYKYCTEKCNKALIYNTILPVAIWQKSNMTWTSCPPPPRRRTRRSGLCPRSAAWRRPPTAPASPPLPSHALGSTPARRHSSPRYDQFNASFLISLPLVRHVLLCNDLYRSPAGDGGRKQMGHRHIQGLWVFRESSADGQHVHHLPGNTR